ncbi:MAG: NADH:ubiquinone oxidoreductase [Candidatus Eisenbacteria bacterium]|nr:NADH:ubiquinone oxidoreductase [Candidatus Latescibacterota bacterium]MBD3301039.1 NADH:ubiquinone oxidoreductase [Candidatus Eisenbacteria bacterium]
MKPKVGVFSFTSCEGCQLTILNLEDEMLDLLGAIEIVNFREAIDERGHEYDVAFVEGSITTPEEAEEVREIRERTKILVALGACATLGGINAIKNRHDLHQVRRKVYGDGAHHFPTEATQRVRDVVPVEYEMHGCPISKREFLQVTKTLLLGRVPRPSPHAVCTECKTAGNVCLFDKGICCLGPITRAGCGAICPTYGGDCVACRGLVDEPNLASMIEIMKSKGMSRQEVEDRLTQFNTLEPVDLEPHFSS